MAQGQGAAAGSKVRRGSDVELVNSGGVREYGEVQSEVSVSPADDRIRMRFARENFESESPVDR